MKAIENAPTSIFPSQKPLPPIQGQMEICQSLFLEIVNNINHATTLEGLFTSTMELAPVTVASYHNFPSVGAFDYQSLGTYYGYNLPTVVENYYETYQTIKADPGLLAIFAKGRFIWASDLLFEPVVLETKHVEVVQRANDILGDGLCIPLFGPNNRRGYMFVKGDLIKKENGDYLPYQIQALAQLFHSRFCLMIQNITRQINLTEREAQVLELLCFGKTNQDVADVLDISASTVSGHVKNIFIKLDVSDRVSASMRAQSMKVAL